MFVVRESPLTYSNISIERLTIVTELGETF